jgi:hypothetical protein
MKQKIHMHDQVFNKVEDIMNHYKRNPVDDLMRLLKQFMKQSSVIWCRQDCSQRKTKLDRPKKVIGQKNVQLHMDPGRCP